MFNGHLDDAISFRVPRFLIFSDRCRKNGTELFKHLLKHGLNLVFLGHVGFVGVCPHATPLDVLDDLLRGLGCVKVNLQVRSINAAVVAFYQSLGFEVEDRISMGLLS